MGRITRLVVVVVLLLLLLVDFSKANDATMKMMMTMMAAAAADECTLTKGGFVSFETLEACLRSVPFDDSVRLATLDSIEKTLPLYIFRHLSLEDPVRFNITDALGKLHTKPFSSDVEFHHDLSATFRLLMDGHTTYTAPTCYGTAYFLQPFQLISYVSEHLHHQVIGISGINGENSMFPGLDQHYLNVYGIDVRSFVGGVIEQINGVHALDVLVEFANHTVGSWKDIGTRFNEGIGGLFSTRRQHRFDIPESDNITYTIRTSDDTVHTLHIPWVGTSTANFTDTTNFAAACKLPPSSSSSTAATTTLTDFPITYSVEDVRDYLLPESTPPTTISASNGNGDMNGQYQLLVDGDQIKFWRHVGDNIGVLQIVTFGPRSIEQFAHDAQLAFFKSKFYGLSRLIIDITGNGGGEECLGYALIKFLSPHFFVDYENLFGRTDMIFSDMGLQLVTRGAAPENQNISGVWNPTSWRSADGVVYQNLSWFTPGTEFQRGGVLANYSSLVKENYCSSMFQYFDFSGGFEYSWTPDNIIVLSDGRSASTAALFSRHLQQSQRVKTVVVGGLHNQPQKIAGIEGGQVYEQPDLISDIEHYGLADSPCAPKRLPTTAWFRFALRETYAWRTDVPPYTPLEFFWEASDFRVPYSKESATNVTLVWNEVSSLFAVCAVWQQLACDTPHGIAYRHCANGQYEETCVLESCVAGYQPNSNLTACVPCHTGTFKSNASLAECSPCTHKPSDAHWVENTTALASDSCPFACDQNFGLVGDTCEHMSISIASVLVGLGLGLVCGCVMAAAAVVITIVATRFMNNKRATPHDPEARALLK